MTSDLILAEIHAVLAAELSLARPIALEHRLSEDLGVDSLVAMVMAVHLEDKFQIKLDEQDAPSLHTVGDVVALVRRRIDEK
jgi:acyl carrier protein